MDSVIRFLIFTAGMVFGVSTANAHEWYNKYRDPLFPQTTCCGGSDCGPIPPHALSFHNGMVEVTLTLEEAQNINPLRQEPFAELIPIERIQTSEDGQWHICLMRSNYDDYGDEKQGFYCIFAPPTG